MAGDRLWALLDCSRRKVPVGVPTCGSSARLSNKCVAHARNEAHPGPPSPQKNAVPAGHVQGTWGRSSHALPSEAGYTRAGTPELTMPLHWTAHDARTDARVMAAIIGVRPLNAADRRVCEARIAITRRSSEATHCCATLSHLSSSVTPARHTILLRRAASNRVHWKTDGGASPAKIASRSRHKIVKIPGLRERHFEAGARPRTFSLTANQRAHLPSADRRV